MNTARNNTEPDEFCGDEELCAVLKKAGEAKSLPEVPPALDFAIRSAAAAQAEKNRTKRKFRPVAWASIAAMFVIVCSLSFFDLRQNTAPASGVVCIDSAAIEQSLQKSAEFDADLTAFSVELNLNSDHSDQWYASMENDSIYQFNF